MRPYPKIPIELLARVVVKLFNLNGKEKRALHRACNDPVLAPRELERIETFADWVLSAAAGIVPPTAWRLPTRQVALLAVLSKLVRNKSWNTDRNGHMWTKDDDLMGQAPVNRPDHQRIYGEAVGCVGMATGTLLLTKGGKQGTTPTEWCINTVYLPAVKRAIVARDVEPLRKEAALRDLLAFVDDGPADMVEVDKVIISEKVLATCRDTRAGPASGPGVVAAAHGKVVKLHDTDNSE